MKKRKKKKHILGGVLTPRGDRSCAGCVRTARGLGDPSWPAALRHFLCSDRQYRQGLLPLRACLSFSSLSSLSFLLLLLPSSRRAVTISLSSCYEWPVCQSAFPPCLGARQRRGRCGQDDARGHCLAAGLACQPGAQMLRRPPRLCGQGPRVHHHLPAGPRH
jgi:hypothetical protein